MRASSALLALCGLVLAGAAAAEDFHWQGRIPAGHDLEIRGINGDIDASLAPGAEADVVATKRARHGDPASVEIKVVERAGGVLICAVYPGRGPGHDECGGAKAGHERRDENDVEVHFRARVPRGVSLRASTVNGGVQADGLEGPVDAETVNGDVRVAVAGSARAQSVNGSIRASLARATGSEPLEFQTVNGSIEVSLPADVDADLRADTVNGSIDSDFPLENRSSRRHPPQSARGRLGSGGRRLDLETVNGNVILRTLH